jgi:tetrahydromethanopterin S-methyltransferase subunit G
MQLTLRRIKKSKLTHDELDDNFEILNLKVENKADKKHHHSIDDIQGLKDELENKVDFDNVNEPNGVVLLDANGKIPAALLPEENSNCDCEKINSRLDNVEKSLEEKVSLKEGKIPVEYLPEYNTRIGIVNVRYANEDSILNIEDEVIFTTNLAVFDISKSLVEGRTITMRNFDNDRDIDLKVEVRWLNDTVSNIWTRNFKKIRLVYWHSIWWQI